MDLNAFLLTLKTSFAMLMTNLRWKRLVFSRHPDTMSVIKLASLKNFKSHLQIHHQRRLPRCSSRWPHPDCDLQCPRCHLWICRWCQVRGYPYRLCCPCQASLCSCSCPSPSSSPSSHCDLQAYCPCLPGLNLQTTMQHLLIYYIFKVCVNKIVSSKWFFLWVKSFLSSESNH